MTTTPGTTRDPLGDVRPDDRWLVIVAHPDDETFGCGSIIAHAAEGGADVSVACATRGEAGETTDAIPNGADLATIREAELRTAADTLGATRVVVLDYVDSGFDGEAPAGTLCAAPLPEVTAAIGRLLRDIKPDIVVVLDGSDGHRDHVRVREATRAAFADAAPGDNVPVQATLYEHCLSNGLMRQWLDEMRKDRGDSAYHALDPASLGRPDDEITDVLDVGHLLERREAAIAQHRSQTSPFEGLSDPLRRAFLTRDYLARVRI